MALSPIDYSCALRAPRGILDRLRVMQESGWTLCPFLGRAFCSLSREATRGEGDLRILWLRRLGIRRRCGSRGRIDSKMRRVWFVNGTAWAENPNIGNSQATLLILFCPHSPEFSGGEVQAHTDS